jgi:UDP-N-acetylmuramoyl-L-alanyl-D-glutamate--2,6-diaminopimelate ligase
MKHTDLLKYRLKRPFHFIKTGILRGLVGQLQYGFPANKLKIITITGTDGKTTSSTLLYHVLKTAGKKVALLSTVAAYIGQDEIDTGLHVTSPDPKHMHRILRRMVNEGMEYVVLEVTSHGAYQYRTWGISPLIGGVTNIAHEHLDYHLDYDEYIKAKALILDKSKSIVLNADDGSFNKLRRILKKKNQVVSTYSATDRIAPSVAGAISRRFPEAYNNMNSRLVYTIARQLDVPAAQIAEGIETFPGVIGRMQEVPTRRPFTIIVDFAHTPQGLEAALTALRKRVTGSGRLIAVHGAAGLRDSQKRPVMGKISSDIADLVIFTAEDPRTEDVWAIIRQMKENITDNIDKVMSIADRGKAIDFAINNLAQKGDVIGIFGKGHEKSMCFGTTEYPWNDVEAVHITLRGE